MKLTDLKDLRVIKKNLEPQPEPQPEPKPQQNQPRKRSVELRSKEEKHARNDGLTIRAVRSEFIPVDAEEDRRLRNAIPSRSHKADKEEPVFEDNTGTLAASLRKELDEVFALSCTYTYSTPGITNVTIR